MQLYGSRESPLWIRGLTLRQRFSYFASFMAYFEALQKLVLLATPALIIVLDVFPMRVHLWDFVVRWVPYFAISIIANVAAGRGHFRYFQTEKYNLLKMIVFIQATLILFTRRPQSFKVTPKSAGAQVYAAEARSLSGYLVIYAILTATVIFGLLKVNSWDETSIGIEALVITLSWALYNAFTLLGGLSDVLSRPHERQQYRFLVNLNAELDRRGISPLPAHVQLRDLSPGGVGFIADPGTTPMDLPASISFFSSRGKLIRLPIVPAHAHNGASGRSRLIGASIVNPHPDDRDRLFEFLYVDLPETWRHSFASEGAAFAQVVAEKPIPEPTPPYAVIVQRT
jgi:cellulose synthase (UDP-forming)